MSGDWSYKLKNAGNGFMIREADPDIEFINLADVFMTNDPKIAENRARLMAAAPEMYAACQVAFTALWAIKARLGKAQTEKEEAAMQELQRRMDTLKTAMQKARGEL